MALGHLSVLTETKLIRGKNREVVCVFMSTKSGATRSLFAKHFARLTLGCCQSHSARSTFPGNSPSCFSRLCTFIHVLTLQSRAIEHITDNIHKLDSISPDAPKFILGDFNHCSLNKTLKTYHQYVTCPTRFNKTTDVFRHSAWRVHVPCITSPWISRPQQCASGPCVQACHKARDENREGLDRGQYCMFAGVF